MILSALRNGAVVFVPLPKLDVLGSSPIARSLLVTPIQSAVCSGVCDTTAGRAYLLAAATPSCPSLAETPTSSHSTRHMAPATRANQERLLANDREIVANQRRILRNQEQLAEILRNQRTIMRNQDAIIKNQKKIMTKQGRSGR